MVMYLVALLGLQSYQEPEGPKYPNARCNFTYINIYTYVHVYIHVYIYVHIYVYVFFSRNMLYVFGCLDTYPQHQTYLQNESSGFGLFDPKALEYEVFGLVEVQAIYLRFLILQWHWDQRPQILASFSEF